MADSCIFCKIAQGQLPSEKLDEGPHWFAILDINPISPGHALVISREHYADLLEAPVEVAQAMIAGARKVAPAVLKATSSEGFNILENNHRCSGQAIPHIHVHVIPRKTGDGVSFRWNPQKYPAGELEKMGNAVRNVLKVTAR